MDLAAVTVAHHAFESPDMGFDCVLGDSGHFPI
jgi:hypothetical protein